MSEYRDDIHSAHAKIASLESEKRALEEKLAQAKSQKAPKEKKMKCHDCMYRMGNNILFGLATLVAVVPLVWLIALAIIHNGERGSCYVESGGEDNLFFHLEREVPWNPDDTLGRYRSMDEALADAKKLNCEVK